MKKTFDWSNVISNIKSYVTSHWFGLTGLLLLFIFLFITPSFLTTTEVGYLINLWVLIITAFVLIVGKVVQFFRKNKHFVPSESAPLISGLGSVLAIIIGLIVGLIIMYIVNPEQAFQGFLVILKGGFNQGMASFGTMIYYAVPIILTGLSVSFAFRTGLFNIGASGQLIFGAFVAVYIGIKWDFLAGVPFLHWFVAVLGALLAGAAWGAIPGLLKAYRNVNEVVSSIMLNYIAVYWVAIMIKADQSIYFKTQDRLYDILPSAVTPKFGLDQIFVGSQINIGIVVAILIAIILYIILFKTTFGYELKAVGLNRDAAKYAGVNAKRNIVLSMIISGAVAGIAGAMIFLDRGAWFKPEIVLRPEGFTGIAISLLGLNHPFGVVFAGLFYGSLERGGEYLNLLRFKHEIIDIIIAVIIYVSALGLILQKLVIKNLKWNSKIFQKIKRVILKESPSDQSEGGATQ